MKPIRTHTHWWTPELDTLQRKIKSLRREFHRSHNPETASEIKFHQEELRRNIRLAKKTAWRKFITVEKAWGKPYKVIVKPQSRPKVKVPPQTLLWDKFGPRQVPPNEMEEHNNESQATSCLHQQSDDLGGYEVSSEMLVNILKKVNNRSSPGFDKINYKLLKILNKSAPDVLRNLYQACLRYRILDESSDSQLVVVESH